MSLTKARRKHRIPTLKEMTRYIAIKLAWSRKLELEQRLLSQGPKPSTRAGKFVFIKKADSKLEKLAIEEFNGLPEDIKNAQIFNKKATWRHIYGDLPKASRNIR